MRINKYYLAAFSAFFIWGFFSLALKPLHNYPSLDILFYRVFFSVVVMVLINVAFRRKVMQQNWNHFKNMTTKKRKNVVVLTLGGGLFLSSNWFVFIYVMNHVSVKAASLAYLICPILTTVFAFFMLKEKLSKWQWIAVTISVFSCILLSFNHFEDIFYSLITAATYALYLVSQRKNSELDKFLVLTIQLLFAAIILLPFYPNYSGAIPTEPLFYGCLLVIVVFFTIIPLFLNLYALNGINSSAVGIMIYINPIIGFLLAIFYYNEQATYLQLFSYFLILVSIAVFNEKLIFPRKLKAVSSKMEGLK
ncbi:EamA family transporter [Flavobacterium gawalongense]|uniref:EamA family transporter n=1 Tax=Flavobacterium gawalongense TaxID=2594432 RepID=A0A553BRB9_9FLAO|nr:EamA family transporter [Flavobacterium gawalongense]TRX03443.1 EamA family transporter [Flavobacterium gawalongense]TRX06788.1 EamA family transporter [Flavobacterium gawalongense]TRX10791.1 EamA family transporter [Flavobacterium gawalongense]TRX11513.1 EamA family transporter [Flavobacterium gawalongense]TRX29283.1 EamA family transporter [Flavobacterium gawalongense]